MYSTDRRSISGMMMVSAIKNIQEYCGNKGGEF